MLSTKPSSCSHELSGDNYGCCNALVFFSDGHAISVMNNRCTDVAAIVVRVLRQRDGRTRDGTNLAMHRVGHAGARRSERVTRGPAAAGDGDRVLP